MTKLRHSRHRCGFCSIREHPYPFDSFSKVTWSAPPSNRDGTRFNNGNLLTAAEDAGFDLFVTTDRSMRYQQTLAGRKIAVVVLSRQQWQQLKPNLTLIVNAVNAAIAGSFIEVEIPFGYK